ncbi:MAG: class I SAM-dependent methyltransferase [Sphingobacteriia bacterium]|nr:class I SAM-dependent methyltransferase [Sphingobacteriia bacterium]
MIERKLNFNYNRHFIESSFFNNMRNLINEERLEYLENASKILPIPEMYGSFFNDDHYFKTLNLLINSTDEVRHIYHVISKMILPNLTSYNSFLDVGCGDGKFTRFIGKNFDKITAVDVEQSALNNLQPYHFSSNKKVTKILGSIADVNLPTTEQYDFILLAHIIYYIDQLQINDLINNLRKKLSKNGRILIIIDEGLDREKLVQHFGAKKKRLLEDVIIENLLNKVNVTVETHLIKETFKTKSINTMMHIAGICLNDAKAIAEENKLKEYLMYNHFKNDYYEINMFQKFIIIKNDSTY